MLRLAVAEKETAASLGAVKCLSVMLPAFSEVGGKAPSKLTAAELAGRPLCLLLLQSVAKGSLGQTLVGSGGQEDQLPLKEKLEMPPGTMQLCGAVGVCVCACMCQ